MDGPAGMGNPWPRQESGLEGRLEGQAQRNSRRGQGSAAGRKFSILGADSKCLFCGVNRLVEDGIRGRLLRTARYSPGAQPAGGCGRLQQPRPVLAMPGLLALRIPTATHLAIRKKMHRLHLASRWDCPPVYFQGTW